MGVQSNEIWKLYLLAHLYMMTNQIKLKCGKNNTNKFANLKQRIILCGNLYYLLNISTLNLNLQSNFSCLIINSFFNVYEDICLNTMVCFNFEKSILTCIRPNMTNLLIFQVFALTVFHSLNSLCDFRKQRSPPPKRMYRLNFIRTIKSHNYARIIFKLTKTR